MKLFRKEEINGDGACPTYLYRWTLLRLGPIAVYLHHFVGDDWSRDLHDHPKRFVSIGLKGGYCEWTTGDRLVPQRVGLGSTLVQSLIGTEFRAPWIRSFPASHAHRITVDPSQDCWTLVIVGPKVRGWGFWHEGYFVPWHEYVRDQGLVAEVKSCP